MECFAHSRKDGILPQSYAVHIENVREMAEKNAQYAAQYAENDAALLTQCANLSAEYHDLGKLDPLNQNALHEDWKRGPLPINHVDAGAALLKKSSGAADFAAMIVYSHHRGLPNLAD